MPEYLVGITTKVAERYWVVADSEEQALKEWQEGGLDFHDVLEITDGPHLIASVDDD